MLTLACFAGDYIKDAWVHSEIVSNNNRVKFLKLQDFDNYSKIKKK